MSNDRADALAYSMQGMLGGALGGLAAQQGAAQAQANQSAMQQQYSQQQFARTLDGDYVLISNEELRLREENPGVKDAWEKYQIMLKLASTV